MGSRGAWGGTKTGPGGFRRAGQAPPLERCACGGEIRVGPVQEGAFLVPGRFELRCERCGAPPPRSEEA